MLKYFRIKQEPEKVVPDLGTISLSLLERDATLPFTIRQLNNLPANVKQRMYRGLIPPALLTRFGIDPIQWTNASKEQMVSLKAEKNSEKVLLTAQSSPNVSDEFFALELADNSLNGIELNLIVLNDPTTPRFSIDRTEDGAPTMFGTLKRNLSAEEKAMQAGLAPRQVRAGLGGSRMVFEQLEAFLSMLGHRAYFLEPLTYASAWVFERRGFAYVRGHKLMDDIHREFQPGGKLYEFRGFIKEHCAIVPRVTDEILYDIQLAVDEACTNIISHGYAGMDPGSIILDLDIDTDRITISLTDFGHAFEPSSTPMPDVDAPIEERELGGFGLFFIQQSMDEIDYQVTEDGNKMILTKFLRKPDGG